MLDHPPAAFMPFTSQDRQMAKRGLSLHTQRFPSGSGRHTVLRAFSTLTPVIACEQGGERQVRVQVPERSEPAAVSSCAAPTWGTFTVLDLRSGSRPLEELDRGGTIGDL
jgi:hypothetical protein